LSRSSRRPTEARRERELAEQLLSQHAAQTLADARIEPPSYVVQDLGERPTEPAKARAWDQAVRDIERYRLEHGVSDTTKAFGPKPLEPDERMANKEARRSLADHQPRLELSHRLEIRERGIEMNIGGPGSSAPTRAIEAPDSRPQPLRGSADSRP
jgi:hypothetical protein